MINTLIKWQVFKMIKENLNMDKYLIGIDVGTTGAKAMILNKEGKIYGKGYGEYPCKNTEFAKLNK